MRNMECEMQKCEKCKDVKNAKMIIIRNLNMYN